MASAIPSSGAGSVPNRARHLAQGHQRRLSVASWPHASSSYFSCYALLVEQQRAWAEARETQQ